MKYEKQIYGGVITFAFWYIDEAKDQKGRVTGVREETVRGGERERELLLDIPYGKSKSLIDFSNTTMWNLVIFQIAIMLAFHWKVCVLHIILACEKLFPLSHKNICKILVGGGPESLHVNFFFFFGSLFTFQQHYFFKYNKNIQKVRKVNYYGFIL